MNRKFSLLITLVFVVWVSYLSPTSLVAQGVNRPFGGKVISTEPELSATVVCTAQYGPFNIKPVNASVPGIFFIQTGKSGRPQKSRYTLGSYNPIANMTTCYNPETGAPVPAFSIKTYGVSK